MILMTPLNSSCYGARSTAGALAPRVRGLALQPRNASGVRIEGPATSWFTSLFSANFLTTVRNRAYLCAVPAARDPRRAAAQRRGGCPAYLRRS